MRFAAPEYFWLLLLIPTVAAMLAAAQRARHRALCRFVAYPLVSRLVVAPSPRRRLFKSILQIVGLLLVVLAFTRPRLGAGSLLARQRGVDVVLALDVSRSMLAEDVKPSRMERAVFQIRALLDRMRGHRVGLVLFAGRAFLQCPLTLDYSAVDMFLDLAQVAAVPIPGTDLGDAVRVATDCFDAAERQYKVIVLFTDGEDHGNAAVAAADAAAAAGVRIFTVGLGSTAGALIPVGNDVGEVRFHRDRAGNPVSTRLNASLLRDLALRTDGDYYHSSLGGDELRGLAGQVAGMARKDLGARYVMAYAERFQWPLGIGLACLLVHSLLGDGQARRRAWRGRFA